MEQQLTLCSGISTDNPNVRSVNGLAAKHREHVAANSQAVIHFQLEYVAVFISTVMQTKGHYIQY